MRIILSMKPDFPGGAEFFLKIAGQKGPLAEVPFDLHYEQRGSDQSKIRLLATIRKYLHLLRFREAAMSAEKTDDCISARLSFQSHDVE